MERFFINRNAAKSEARALISVKGDEQYRSVSYVVENGEIVKDRIVLNLDSEYVRGLSVGETLYFRKRSGNPAIDQREWGVYGEAPVIIEDIIGNSIVVSTPNVINRNIISIETDMVGPRAIRLDEKCWFLPEDFTETTITATTDTTWYDEDSQEWMDPSVWTLTPVYRKRDSGDDDSEYDDEYNREYINTSIFGTGDDNIEKYRLPTSFITDINEYFYEVGENEYRLFSSVELVKMLEYFEIKANLQTSDETNLLQQNTITDFFSSEIKEKIIPEFIDMEKFMFEPVMDSSGEILCDEFVFNFHFRERAFEYVPVDEITPFIYRSAHGYAATRYSEEEALADARANMYKYMYWGSKYYELVYDKSWSVVEDGWWNKINSGTTMNPNVLEKSDLLGYLNFDDEDVRYQKMKIKKSFIRLSFYDTDNPLTQQLLYYSTIFLDSGTLFGNFVRGRAKDKHFGVYTEDDENRLSTRVTVKNKFDNDKSSEGFYIYLFNNETTKDGKSKNIYMKVEFNHAGYGRTLPMVKPKVDANKKPKAIPFKDYFSSQFIKLAAKTLPTGETNHIYYVDDDNKFGVEIDNVNRRIIFNLFEVKIA